MHAVEQEGEEVSSFANLLHTLIPEDGEFDIQSAYEYFSNHYWDAQTMSSKFNLYECVLLILRHFVDVNYHKLISVTHLKYLMDYISRCEMERYLCILHGNAYGFPVSRYYMKVMKFELVQYSVTECAYLLRVRCINFQEKDVHHSIDVVHYFFSQCIDRVISVCPQIKWKFVGNSYMNITWIIGIPKYLKDNFTGYRRALLNECWNDYFDGSSWKNTQSKSLSLMDYMKELTGYKGSEGNSGGTTIKNWVKRTSTFLEEVDDTIFAKFSPDEKENVKTVFSWSSIALIFIMIMVLVIRWWYRR